MEGQDARVARNWIEGVVTDAGPFPEGTLTIHAERGSPMRSKALSVLLADPRIGRTRSRPHLSHDNATSEVGFKTLKYAPDFPGSFGSLQDARAFVGPFRDFYNHHHRHAGIGHRTPASVYVGTAGVVRVQRVLVLDAAYAAHPERFTNKRPEPPDLPGAAWINKPKEVD